MTKNTITNPPAPASLQSRPEKSAIRSSLRYAPLRDYQVTAATGRRDSAPTR